MKLKDLLEFALPAKWRGRSAPTDRQLQSNDGVMARLGESDPVFRAMGDWAHKQFEEDLLKALLPGLSAEDRAFWCGRAGAMATYLIEVDNWRERAHNHMQKLLAQHGPGVRR